MDHGDRPPAVSGLPTQRRPPADLQPRPGRRPAPSTAGWSGPAAAASPHSSTSNAHRTSPKPDPGRHRARTEQRPRRIGQHQDQSPHPGRLRLPLPRPLDRPRHAQPRTPPTSPPRPVLTHRHVRRVQIRRGRPRGYVRICRAAQRYLMNNRDDPGAVLAAGRCRWCRAGWRARRTAPRVVVGQHADLVQSLVCRAATGGPRGTCRRLSLRSSAPVRRSAGRDLEHGVELVVVGRA